MTILCHLKLRDNNYQSVLLSFYMNLLYSSKQLSNQFSSHYKQNRSVIYVILTIFFGAIFTSMHQGRKYYHTQLGVNLKEQFEEEEQPESVKRNLEVELELVEEIPYGKLNQDDGYDQLVSDLKDELNESRGAQIKHPQLPLPVYHRFFIENNAHFKRENPKLTPKELAEVIKKAFENLSDLRKSCINQIIEKEYQLAYDYDYRQYEEIKRIYDNLTRPPKRPNTAYFIFFSDRYHEEKRRDPNINNIESATEISKEWNTLDPDTKLIYEQKANDLKLKYKEDLKNFQQSKIDEELIDSYNQKLHEYEMRLRESNEYHRKQAKEEQKQDERRKYNEKPAQRDLENILGIKTVNGKKLYLIKWIGESVQLSTWEKEEDLAGFEDVIKIFEDQYYLPFPMRDESEEEQKLDKKEQSNKTPVSNQVQAPLTSINNLLPANKEVSKRTLKERLPTQLKNRQRSRDISAKKPVPQKKQTPKKKTPKKDISKSVTPVKAKTPKKVPSKKQTPKPTPLKAKQQQDEAAPQQRVLRAQKQEEVPPQQKTKSQNKKQAVTQKTIVDEEPQTRIGSRSRRIRKENKFDDFVFETPQPIKRGRGRLEKSTEAQPESRGRSAKNLIEEKVISVGRRGSLKQEEFRATKSNKQKQKQIEKAAKVKTSSIKKKEPIEPVRRGRQANIQEEKQTSVGRSQKKIEVEVPLRLTRQNKPLPALRRNVKAKLDYGLSTKEIKPQKIVAKRVVAKQIKKGRPKNTTQNSEGKKFFKTRQSFKVSQKPVPQIQKKIKKTVPAKVVAKRGKTRRS